MARLKSLTINDTGSLTLPNGTTANRPSATTTVETFTTVGTTSWTAPAGVTNVEVLVVAGGGGGGRPYGGGGGAGGLIYNNFYSVIPGTSYSVTVGAGGTGLAANLGTCVRGNSGADSRFDKLLAIGGGGGGCWGTEGTTGNDVPTVGKNGGSGGGGGARNNSFLLTAAGQLPGTGTSGQGNPGGVGAVFNNGGSGGGGGAGGPGKDAQTGQQGAPGGPGLEFSISGSATYYAGGGGGGIGNSSGNYVAGFGGSKIGGNGGFSTGSSVGGNGQNGAANTGSGGGGAGGTANGATANTAGTSGGGGSGIVVLRYHLTSENETPVGQVRYNTNTRTFENFKGEWRQNVVNKDIVKDGLILHFDAEQNAVSGTTVYDISGNGYTGTFVNGASTSASNGGIFTFDNTADQYIQTNFGKDISKGFTVDFWFYATNTSTYFLASYFASSDSDTVFRIEVNNTLGRLDFGHNPDGASSIGGFELYGDNFDPNAWHHCTLTYDGTTKKLYNDGKLLAEARNQTIIDFAGAQLRIGARQNGALLPINGNIASFKMYNRALTVEEINVNHNAQADRFFIPPIVKTPSIVKNGLIFSVDAADPGSYPGFLSNTINDTSELRNTGTFDGVIIDPRNGGVMEFDGSNDYVNTTFPAQTIDAVTMEAVVYDTKNNGAYRSIIQINLAGDDALYIYPNNNLGFWPCGSDGPPVPANQWCYVSVVYNGGMLEYRVNDEYTKVVKGCGDITDFDFIRLGGHGTGDGERWQGFIALARVYNRALSPQEIQNNFNAIRGRFGI